MANERMMQAISRMERALDRLEAIPTPSRSAAPSPCDPDRGRAVAALQSLDSLIADLKSRG
ncbi:hypothetical protein BH10PSE12_BH10PSE12_00840 [soil metagenome]